MPRGTPRPSPSSPSGPPCSSRARSSTATQPKPWLWWPPAPPPASRRSPWDLGLSTRGPPDASCATPARPCSPRSRLWRGGELSEMSAYDHTRAIRILGGILVIAVVVSIVHYTDNYVNYDDYPQATSVPNPSAGVVLGAWVAFTAAGLAGYLLFRRGPSTLALILLAAYAGSG